MDVTEGNYMLDYFIRRGRAREGFLPLPEKNYLKMKNSQRISDCTKRG
jgi:hypothetical protein